MDQVGVYVVRVYRGVEGCHPGLLRDSSLKVKHEFRPASIRAGHRCVQCLLGIALITCVHGPRPPGRFGVIRLANRSLPPTGARLLARLHEVDAEVVAEEAALARTLVGKVEATVPRRRTTVPAKRRVLA